MLMGTKKGKHRKDGTGKTKKEKERKGESAKVKREVNRQPPIMYSGKKRTVLTLEIFRGNQ